MIGLSSSPWIPVLSVLAIHLAAFALGRRLVRLVHLNSTRAEKLLHAQLLGFMVLASLTFALAASGLAHRLVLVTCVAVAALAGLTDVVRLRPQWSWSRSDVPALLALVFLIQFLPEATSPVLSQDDLVYHLFLPREYLEAHAFVDLPWHVNANMPHVVEVLYMVPMAIGDFTAPKLLVLSFAALTMAGLWGAASRLCGRFAAGLVLLLYLSGKNVQWHLGIAHVEPVVGAYLLGATLALEAWLRERSWGTLALLGNYVGFAAAAKYTGWLYATALLVPVVVLVRRSPTPLRRLAWLLSLAALPVVPWLIKNVLYTGNPIFPNLHSVWGAGGWSDVQELHYRLAMRTVQQAGPAWTLLDIVKMPFHLTVSDAYYSCPSFSIVLMTLLLVAPFLRLSTHERVLVGVTWLGFAGWALSAPQGRYLVAWVPVMLLPAAFALRALCRTRNAWAVAIAVIVGVGAYQLVAQRMRFAPRWTLLAQSRQELVRQNPAFGLNQYLNRNVDTEGRVVGLWENRFFFLERDFEADAVWQVPSLLARLREVDDAARFAQQLRDEGVTHVVLHPGRLNSYFADEYAYSMTDERVYPTARYERDHMLVSQFIREQLEPIGQFGENQVFLLGAASKAATTSDP